MNKFLFNISIFFIAGALILFLGAILGLLIGMNIGGNNPPAFQYGGLPGYEGAGLLGSIIGASLSTFLWISYRLKEQTRLKRNILFISSTIIVILLQDYIARHNGMGNFFLTFLPLASQSLLFIWYRPNELFSSGN